MMVSERLIIVLSAVCLCAVTAKYKSPPVCFYDGQPYKVGRAFTATDGCNKCECLSSGEVECTAMNCKGPCTFEGGYYKPGKSFKSSDGCNWCKCVKSDVVTCSANLCSKKNKGGY
ncbi:uncharacterized protein LOC143056444 [Mytilus galloprovincialis]|uniref:uncharacterized protein LOC143056444 n=1 Tax=Mytilus galloprovincialis TaxID=29158 RepID=UPI003F7BEBCD